MNNNFNNLSNILFDIYSKMKYILLQYNVTKKIMDINEIEFDDIYLKLNILYKELYKIQNNYILIQGFIDNNYNSIREVKQSKIILIFLLYKNLL